MRVTIPCPRCDDGTISVTLSPDTYEDKEQSCKCNFDSFTDRELQNIEDAITDAVELKTDRGRY